MRGALKTMGTGLVSALAIAITPSASAQTAAQPPALTAEQALQLFAEAGFSLKDGRTINRCGGSSTPRVAFIDLNGDGKAEAHVADVDPKCYGTPGAYFTILAQQPDQSWKSLIAEDGIVGFEKTRTGGWNDLSLDEGDSACPGLRRFDGAAYGSGPCDVLAGASDTASVPSTTNAPLSQSRLLVFDDQTAQAKALPVAQRNAIFRAAGAQQIGGGTWTTCTADTSGRSEATLMMVQDLNDDGRPEALIYDGGLFCNGTTGVSSIVLSQAADGGWNVQMRSQGYVSFLTSRGAANYPDIVLGLPGLCFPYFRWNGAEYDLIAQMDDAGKACQGF